MTFGQSTALPAPPRVSVISIYFNASRYFAEAIDSVLAQSFGDFELLLVDDGSTDDSTSIAAAYAAKDERVRCLHHPGRVNRGMSATRNLGLDSASGELIAFIDADDRWRPRKLEEQIALFDRFPDVDAVCGSVNYWASHDGGSDRIVPTGHVQNRRSAPPDTILRLYPLGGADTPCPSDLLLRRDKVMEVGGFEASFTGPLQMHEDQAFLLKFYLEGAIYFSDHVWLDYRLHDDSCTATVERNGLALDVRRRCLEWFETYLSSTRHWRNPKIRWALWKALRPYRYPHISRIGRTVKSVIFPNRSQPESTIAESS